MGDRAPPPSPPPAPRLPLPGPSPPSGSNGRNSAFSPAVVAIIAVLGSAFLVVSYYRIFAKLCTRWHNRGEELDPEGQLNGAETDANVSPLANHGLDEALIKNIPIFVFKTGDGFTVDTDCPVCLMEFADHQELRMLPKCAHAFHVACIDTWLATHSTCPLCRANIWPDHIMSQYSTPSPPLVDDLQMPLGTQGVHDPTSERTRVNGDGFDRSPATPTLRGLLNFEDQQHTIWVPDSVERGDPGEESLRLFDPRDHGGDSSARHHSGILPAAVTPTQSISENVNSSCGTYFSTDTGPQVSLTRSTDRDHKWRIPGNRPSFRKNPFSIKRSYSMGTSRRLVHALEFLDLEDLRNSQSKGREKLYSPHEYGITTTPDYHTISPMDLLAIEKEKSLTVAGHVAGPSTLMKEPFLISSKSPGSSSDLDSSGAVLKKSGSGRGRSLSFRSPFTLKRSLSAGRSMFLFRHSTKGRLVSSDFSTLPSS